MPFFPTGGCFSGFSKSHIDRSMAMAAAVDIITKAVLEICKDRVCRDTWGLWFKGLMLKLLHDPTYLFLQKV